MEMSWKITYPAVNKIEIKKISHFTFQFFSNNRFSFIGCDSLPIFVFFHL